MTLVELLIVVGIMAVIAGLSMSVLLKVRQRAYLATCISNLRQLVQAVHMYEDDWGTVPIERPVETDEGTYGFVDQLLYPYVRNDAVFICPADFTEGQFSYSEDEEGNPTPSLPERRVFWKGKEWRTSYLYFINYATIQTHAKGSPKIKSHSTLFICCWHLPHYRVYLLGRYDGVVEIAPYPLGRRHIVEFE